MLAERRLRIDFALHDVKFVVDRRKARFGLDQDQPIHAVCNVLGDHGRRAVINVEPGNEGLECHRFFGPRIDLQRRSASAGTGGRVKIHGVDHVAVGGVLEMNVNGIADADANEWAGYLAVKRPVAECGRFREPAFLFNGEEVEPDGLGVSFAERRRQIGRFAGNVGFDQRLRRSYGRYQKLTLHACQSVTGNAAEIEEVSGFRRTKNNRRARALAVHSW